jgi:hypothetical protein
MATENKYSFFSKEELAKEELKLKNFQKVSVAFCVICTFSVFFQVYKKSPTGLWSSWSILIALFFMAKFGGDLKKVREEIEKRKN